MDNSDDIAFVEDQKIWVDVSLGRRRFLQWGLFSTASLTATSIGGIFLRFLLGNSLQIKAGEWVDLGVITDLPPGQIHKVAYSYQTTDAWKRIKQEGALYAYRKEGHETYTALDATCTHLGCLVRWQETAGHFSCPCHEGTFTRDGLVISGAPTKPLRRYVTKIENGRLFAEI